MELDLDEATFIDLVRQFPHLWDKKEKQYSDQVATENAWSSISEIMKIPGKV